MKFDTKQQVLIAIYIEYQKDIPEMGVNIRHDVLGIEKEAFDIAIAKLQNEELINGAAFTKGGGKLLIAWTDSIMMTRLGIEYVETKIGVQHVMTGKEKLDFIIKNAVSWGWDQLKDIAARTLNEMSKQ